MNILFLTLSKIKDINTRSIYTDLMRKFRDEGHEVYIVTPTERREHRTTNLYNQSGVHILSVWTLNIQKTNIVEKGIGTVSIELLFYIAINKYLKDIHFDLILYSTPPITFSNVVSTLKKKNNATTYLLLKDIFPQNAVDLQMFSKRSLFYWYFRSKEKQLYKISDYIGCMSPANVDFVLEHNLDVDKRKVEVNPNSIELKKSELTADEKKNIRLRNDLPIDKPIFIYGGNLGKPQGINFLLKVLESNKQRNDLYFLIIGDGTEFSKISNYFIANSPTNATLMQRLPKEEYDKLVSSCDVGLIFLDPRFTIPNYPSRLLSYLEYKMPIVAATDVNTDIGRIAEQNGYGYWCENGDIDRFNEAIDKLLDIQQRTEVGEKGYQYLVNNYLVFHSYRTIMNHF